MKVIKMDSGFRLDAPRSYWGDPSFQLEAGEVLARPLISVPHQPKHTMAHLPYLPPDETGTLSLLVALDTNLPGPLAVKYDIDDNMLFRLHQGRLVFDWFFHNTDLARKWAQSLTDDREKLFDSPTGGTVGMPGLPLLGAIPTVTVGGQQVPVEIEPGFFEFLGRLVQQIKNHENWDPADGTVLKIVGAEIAALDPDIVPELKLKINANGRPEGTCKKTPFQGMAYWVARNDGPMVDAGFSTSRNYEIPLPLPAAGTVEVWKVQVQYRYKNQPFGQKSLVMEITVKGV